MDTNTHLQKYAAKRLYQRVVGILCGVLVEQVEVAWPWHSPSAFSPPYPRQPTLPGKQLDEMFYNMQRDLWTEFQSRPSSEEPWARRVQVMVRLELDFQFCTIIYKLCGLQNELFCISFESQKQEGSVKHLLFLSFKKSWMCMFFTIPDHHLRPSCSRDHNRPSNKLDTASYQANHAFGR